jgi:hypothetical protein
VRGDIVVAGLKISAEEWQELDPRTRAELEAVMLEERPKPRFVVYIAGGRVVDDNDVTVR